VYTVWSNLQTRTLGDSINSLRQCTHMHGFFGQQESAPSGISIGSATLARVLAMALSVSMSVSVYHKSVFYQKTHTYIHTYTHTFNGPFSGTTRVGRYQKGKTNLDFTGARDSEWQWHQLGHVQVCTSLQTDNHASTPPVSFYRPGALHAAQPTASKQWRHNLFYQKRRKD